MKSIYILLAAMITMAGALMTVYVGVTDIIVYLRNAFLQIHSSKMTFLTHEIVYLAKVIKCRVLWVNVFTVFKLPII